MNPLDNYFIIKTIGTEEVSEIDMTLYDDLFGEKWSDDELIHPSERIIDNREYYSDGHPIEIDEMLKQLQKMKEKGANFVALNYHYDHIGYQIEGITIKKATEKEVDNFLSVRKRQHEREEKIKDLYKQIKQLDK